MKIVDAIEKLNWLKEEQKRLEKWVAKLDVDFENERPVNGINWKRLKKTIGIFEDDLIAQIRLLEYKINESVGDIEISV